MSEPIKHPRALAIAKRGESCLWDMGDYLLEVAGKPGRYGDGSRGGKIEEVSAELVEHGYDRYDTQYLMKVRLTAHVFPIRFREANLAFTTHLMAGTPEVLQAVVTAAKEQGRKGVSKRYVKQIMDGMDADQKARRKGVQIRAQQAADRAEKRGDKQAAERNRERARKLKTAPKRDVTKRVVPKPEDVPLALVKAKFMADSAEALALARRMEREVTPHIDDLSKAFIVGSVEELLEIAERFRNLATKINRNQTNKRAHLHAVA